MFRKYVFFFLVLCTSSFVSAMPQLPQVIDFSKLPTIDQGYYNVCDSNAWNLGYYAFNYAPELAPFFAMLKKEYNIDTVVETGTFRGGTTVLFSLLFDNVHTIEIQDATYQVSKENLKQFSNVYCHLGSSEKVLKTILPNLKNQRILFYLDAHWQSHWPLLEELKEISKTHKDNCIIVIDDFKVPGRPDVPYDYYGNNECSLKYIKDQIAQVFTAHTFHLVIPKSVNSRAKFVGIPKQWKK